MSGEDKNHQPECEYHRMSGNRQASVRRGIYYQLATITVSQLPATEVLHSSLIRL